MDVPDEQNPAELLKRIVALETALGVEQQRSRDLEAGMIRVATYQGVLHVLKDTGPK